MRLHRILCRGYQATRGAHPQRMGMPPVSHMVEPFCENVTIVSIPGNLHELRVLIMRIIVKEAERYFLRPP